MRSRAPGQSRPMPRWEVSIASAMRKAQIEEIGAKGESSLPVDGGRAGGIGMAERIGDDMGGGEGDAVPGGIAGRGCKRRAREAVASIVPVSVRRGRVVIVCFRIAYMRAAGPRIKPGFPASRHENTRSDHRPASPDKPGRGKSRCAI